MPGGTAMRILVTAGNTQTPIDKVRCITNIFTGRTGTQIALTAHRRGHSVCLITSHPEVVRNFARGDLPPGSWEVRPYRTFDDLHERMAEAIPGGEFDAIIHAAAVSDFFVTGVYALEEGTRFLTDDRAWSAESGAPQLADVRSGKVKSHHGELWLRLTPTPKLADRVRRDWGFRGTFVKFKLEAGLSETDLLAAAERARRQSAADWMVANTFEGRHNVAYIGCGEGTYQRVSREELPEALLERLEQGPRAPWSQSREGLGAGN